VSPEGPSLISTPRLDLLPLGLEHADEMTRVLGDPELHEFIGGEPLDEGSLHARYERLVAGSGDPHVSWLNWVVRSRGGGQLVGTVQATLTRTADGVTAEISWVVGTSWQGQGFAKEAAVGLVDHLTQPGDPTGTTVTLIVAHVHPDHHASAAVARAAGLAPTDRVEDGEVRWERRPSR
jgi:RimJ/RimL family protein N-acetyltransferase